MMNTSNTGNDTGPTFEDDKDKDEEGANILLLKEDIDRLENEKRKERFIFSLIVLMLFDFIVFQKVDDWSGAIVIGILQVLLVIFLGWFLDIKELDDLITKILNTFSRHKADEGETSVTKTYESSVTKTDEKGTSVTKMDEKETLVTKTEEKEDPDTNLDKKGKPDTKTSKKGNQGNK